MQCRCRHIPLLFADFGRGLMKLGTNHGVNMIIKLQNTFWRAPPLAWSLVGQTAQVNQKPIRLAKLKLLLAAILSSPGVSSLFLYAKNAVQFGYC